MVWASDVHRSPSGDCGRKINRHTMEAVFTKQPVQEDSRPFWLRLLTSLRVHIDLKKREFGLRGKADF